MRAAPQLVTGDHGRALPPAARWVLRGAEPARAAAGRGRSAPRSRRPRAAPPRDGERAALWLGPDEWLLIAPQADGEASRRALAAALRRAAALARRREPSPGRARPSSGPRAATLLAAGCPLDLDASAFPPGMCTRTMLAKAEVVLWRTGAESFRLEVWRSFLDYVSAFLAEAARGII